MKKISIILLFFILVSGNVFAQVSRIKNVEALILEGAYQQAASECERILGGRPTSAVAVRAHYLRGICLLKGGKYSQAREDFDLVLRRFRRSGFCDDATLSIADSYFLEGNYEQANAGYRDFLCNFARSELVNIAFTQQRLCLQEANNPYFSVQVGCFSKKDNADKLRDKLIDKGFQAYVHQKSASDLFRVRVGKFNGSAQAERLEKKLQAAGYPTKVCQ